MNFLTACQEASKAAGFQSSIDSVSATGYQGTIVNAVRNKWIQIQSTRTEFEFLRASKTFTISSSTEAYSIATLFSSPTISPVKCWIKDKIIYDYTQLNFLDYDSYLLRDTSNDERTTPSWFSINPVDNTLYFNKVDASYSITAYYYRTPQVLANNTDVLLCPDAQAYAVVYLAAADIAIDLGNQANYTKNLINGSALLNTMMRCKVPAKSVRRRGIA